MKRAAAKLDSQIIEEACHIINFIKAPPGASSRAH
jgi:hypothetical protein